MTKKLTQKMRITFKLFFPNTPRRSVSIEFSARVSLKKALEELQTQYKTPPVTKGTLLLPHYILLINDIQSELRGDLKQLLEDGDKITILSLIHGGTYKLSKPTGDFLSENSPTKDIPFQNQF